MPDEAPSELEALGSKTASGGTIFISGKIAAALANLVILIFLARYLAPVEYGLYTIAISFSFALGMGGNFGLGTALRKLLPPESSKEKHSMLVYNAYLVAGIASAVISIAGVALSGVIATYVYGNPTLAFPIALGAADVLLAVLLNLATAVLVGLGKVKGATYGIMAYSFGQLAATVALVLAGFGIAGAMGGLILGTLIGFLVSLAYIIPMVSARHMHFSKGISKSMTKFSIPIVISNVAQTGAINFGILFLGIFATATVVGNFGAAYRLGKFIEVLLTSSTFVLLPAFSRAVSDSQMSAKISSIFNNSIYFSMLFLVPIAVLIMSTATPAVHVLFSHKYAYAPFYLAIVTFGLLLTVIGTYAGTLLIGYGDTRKFMVYQLAFVAVEFILVIALVPFIKATGLLLALFILGPIMLDVIYVRMLAKQLSVKLHYGQLIRFTASAIILFLLLYAVAYAMHERDLALLVNIILAIAVYPILIGLTGTVKKHNAKLIRSMASGIPGRSIIMLFLRYTELFVR